MKHKPLFTIFSIIILLFAVSLAVAQDDHDTTKAELERDSPIELNPAGGSDIGYVYEAFLSPHQEGGEEDEVPPFTPGEFVSTEPSVDRNERDSRGHAVIEFTQDYSRAYVYLAVENVNPEDVVLLHLHCGKPGQLGPIIVDFGLMGDLQEMLADNIVKYEITNEDIVAAAEHGHGLVAAFTAGCPIIPAVPTDKIKTVAGLAMVARQGELYFNLHTKAQTFFGDIRGEFFPAELGE